MICKYDAIILKFAIFFIFEILIFEEMSFRNQIKIWLQVSEIKQETICFTFLLKHHTSTCYGCETPQLG